MSHRGVRFRIQRVGNVWVPKVLDWHDGGWRAVYKDLISPRRATTEWLVWERIQADCKARKYRVRVGGVRELTLKVSA